MNPTTILIIEALIKYGPTIGAKVREFVTRKDVPTAEEWEALFKEAAISYDEGKARARTEINAQKVNV